ncbi:hypothetical protein MKZ38_003829 [Zalerion maritima]|uniref:Uncharacterized protein n=1 Tax=Zalerion maritima TaxID=339359 RepID=A0AAD5RM84_9PEZI|nr:hypothetical protein MKZ38_003829 [Zalerion maritima]
MSDQYSASLWDIHPKTELTCWEKNRSELGQLKVLTLVDTLHVAAGIPYRETVLRLPSLMHLHTKLPGDQVALNPAGTPSFNITYRSLPMAFSTLGLGCPSSTKLNTLTGAPGPSPFSNQQGMVQQHNQLNRYDTRRSINLDRKQTGGKKLTHGPRLLDPPLSLQYCPLPEITIRSIKAIKTASTSTTPPPAERLPQPGHRNWNSASS